MRIGFASILLGLSTIAACSSNDDVVPATEDSAASDSSVDTSVDTSIPDTGLDSAMDDADVSSDGGDSSDVASDVADDAEETKPEEDDGPDAPAPPFSAGDIVFSEILVRGVHLGTTTEIGEYFELYNRTAAAITLTDCSIESGAGIATESELLPEVTIPSKGYIAIRSAVSGVTYDYSAASTFTSITFEDTAPDFVRLVCAGAPAPIDAVGWNASTIAPSAGTAASAVSLERSTASLAAGVATSTTTWCAGTGSHTVTGLGTSATFMGSPASANACP